jgi:N6-L-threonylcarbamoyladenine synthase
MILAIESSCDESAVALFDPGRGIVSESVHSQVVLHGLHGGVVPDLATREHLRQLGPLLEGIRARQGFAGVREVAVTSGPGLAACLAVGVASAKALALALRVPLTGVNHLRGHVWSPFIPVHAGSPGDFPVALADSLPHLALVVSGGNTLLVRVGEDRALQVLSSTRDDAAGEALDKGAKLLGLGYPGGPLIERRAAGGNPAAFDFPRGIGRRDELDFSFSGLKTSLRYLIEELTPARVEERMADLCASYQAAVVDALARKTRAALRQGEGGYRSVGLSGGVANNGALRAALAAEAADAGVRFLAAEPRHTGDNAAMIAFAAWVDPEGGDRAGLRSLRIAPDAPAA